MKIYLRDIPEEGLDIKEDIAPELIDRREDDDFHFTDVLKVNAHVDRAEDAVIAVVKMSSTIEAICCRCLETVHHVFEKEAVLDFPIEPGMDCIDMTEEIRQEVILNYPDRELCKEDCKGICAECGANLNNELCKCTK